LAGTLVLASLSILLETPLLLYLGKLAPALQKRPFPQIFLAVWVYGFHGDFLTDWIVLGFQASARYYRELQDRKQTALRLELQLSDAV